MTRRTRPLSYPVKKKGKINGRASVAERLYVLYVFVFASAVAAQVARVLIMQNCAQNVHSCKVVVCLNVCKSD